MDYDKLTLVKDDLVGAILNRKGGMLEDLEAAISKGDMRQTDYCQGKVDGMSAALDLVLQTMTKIRNSTSKQERCSN